jgi:hypothetical protein
MPLFKSRKVSAADDLTGGIIFTLVKHTKCIGKVLTINFITQSALCAVGH